MGVIAGPVNSQFDPYKLSWNDQFVNGQYLPANPTQQSFKSTGRNYFDLGMGVAFTRPFGELGNLYVGYSMYHINKPIVSFDRTNDSVPRLAMRHGFNGGLTIPSGARDAFTFYTDAFWQGGNRMNVVGGFYTIGLADEYYDDQNKTSLSLGGVYRWNDAFIPVVKLDYGQLSFGLSYDVNMSKLKTASQSRGGFEFTLSYRNCVIGAERSTGVACPKFGSNF
jgi:type IX secretion system PorP/SprF family membrane protein